MLFDSHIFHFSSGKGLHTSPSPRPYVQVRQKAMMRWTVRFALTASIVSIILLLILKQHLEDLWDQYNVPAYLRSSFKNSFRHGELDHLAPIPGKMGDKIIVMARLEHENTDWVAKNLPESAPLTLSAKGFRILLAPANSAFCSSAGSMPSTPSTPPPPPNCRPPSIKATSQWPTSAT